MNILTDWLGEMTEVPEDTEQLAERLTDIGLEVEEIIQLSEQISDVVVARVEETSQHPDSGNLTICDLVSEGTHAQVVTAAPAVQEDALYIWAPPGSKIPGQAIERQEFQGVTSEGMLCSSRELGLTEDAQTLLKIPEEYKAGQNIVEVLRLDEPILDIDLTPNRSDCLSHLGVARDYAAAEGLDLVDPRPDRLPDGPSTDVEINIENPEDCWSYTGVPIGDVNVASSPFEIQKRILKMGLRPLNNIVDVTNYCLFEVGHPLHPFDYDRIVAPITIRRATNEEQIRTLDGETHEVTDEDLVISDKHGPQALAGIMGGANTQVERHTDRILLEGAYFDPVRVRRTASRLKLSTEASHRFERGTDPESYDRCLARCLELMERDPAHGDELTVFEPITVKENDAPSVQLSFNPGDVPDVLGFDPGEDTIMEQLERLGIQRDGDGQRLNLTVPSWRHDLAGQEDIVEEIVRLHGYEKIPTDYPDINIEETVPPGRDAKELAREFFVASGFNEAITYSFVDPDHHQFVNGEDPLALENPLSRHTETMRRSILDGLVETVNNNLNRVEQSTRFFEIGRVFPPDGDEEPLCLSFIMTGSRNEQKWDDTSSLDFHDASGLVRAMLEYLGYEDVEIEPANDVGLVDHRTATVLVRGESLGTIGQINADTIDLDTDQPVLAGELILDNLPEPDPNQFEPYSTHPAVNRDLDLVVDNDQYVQPMRETIHETTEWIEDITIFDVYEGDPLPDGKKSISFNFTFRHPERTLKDEEVNEVQDEIFERLKDEFDATLRTE